ncbi:MAG: hypothetical protein KAK04_20755, partial [Cyclobacteriaceae bacterium]|nr:hypothetical protein [Cyclobacteriaceae bacterium]
MVINNASLQLVKLKDGGTSGMIAPERTVVLIKSRHSEGRSSKSRLVVCNDLPNSQPTVPLPVVSVRVMALCKRNLSLISLY